MRLAVAPLLMAITAGCASIVNDPVQAIRIDTVGEDGALIAGADCRAANDRGIFAGRSGEEVEVRRSADQLDLICRHPGRPDAEGRAVSRLNAGLVGNGVAGGAVGVMVDQATGLGYTYPVWIRLVFGKSLVFDKASDQEGSPHKGIEPGATR